MTRIALDTNILAYLAGVSHDRGDEDKVAKIRSLVGKLNESASLTAPAQTFGELFVVLRRSGVTATAARDILLGFSEAFTAPPSEIRTALSAADLAVDHKLQFWDALVVSAAVDAACSILLSEDMQHGFVCRGLTIINPLLDDVHPKLAPLLA